mmetsp:Transcript_5098/g.7300  ORF Transcript_5098/g.7300 Transcript_5098/m.7300 type:complete len:615 (+) Transcript_5098:161-2005(+)|eukprot:CAMPEP_0195510608 /NCGR_PEP_ID=MMETSP0794_2-20130614/3207_1 /TAXON_ID=515487 /ORGANISM="Stephanopyxis turris, Strain CCMP 815" /LENGTH=614 /DNA_ID=CAMNT_0040638061 /DNA_START=136 /DNA_END=1980 /DNA_ORIENTATION=+
MAALIALRSYPIPLAACAAGQRRKLIQNKFQCISPLVNYTRNFGTKASDEDGATRKTFKQKMNFSENKKKKKKMGPPPSTVAIDVKTLYEPNMHLPDKPDFNDPSLGYEVATPLSEELIRIIALKGPITVAEYMKQALTHPDYGYYTAPTPSGIHDDFDDMDDDAFDEPILVGSANANKENLPSDRIFGTRGDFTTAPEVSQVFGECLLIWYMTQWIAMDRPSKITLVEVGPGRGTLMADMLMAAIKTFPDFVSAVCNGGGVHLVETSYELRNSQHRTIQTAINDSPYTIDVRKKDLEFDGSDFMGSDENSTIENVRRSKDQKRNWIIPIRWHSMLAAVPNHPERGGPQFITAQEFLDALPVHSFEKTIDGVWRERMVDVATNPNTDHSLNPPQPTSSQQNNNSNKKTRLNFILAPSVTPALRSLLNTDEDGNIPPNLASQDDSLPGDVIEICPEGLAFAQDVARRIRSCDGAALIVDYGSALGAADTVRAFRKHDQVHVLTLPGEVDVTADVDFCALSNAVRQLRPDGGGKGGFAKAFGPSSQGAFLASMGAVERVNSLIEDEKTTEKEATDLYLALERLLLPDQMGERYKVLCIVKRNEGEDGNEEDIPPGF